MSQAKIHYGWERTSQWSCTPIERYAACGRDSAHRLTERWSGVTCKACLRRLWNWANKQAGEVQP